MLVFCKLDHRGTQCGIALFRIYLMHIKAMDPPQSVCGPLGVHGPPVGNRCLRSSADIKAFLL